MRLTTFEGQVVVGAWHNGHELCTLYWTNEPVHALAKLGPNSRGEPTHDQCM